MDTIKLLQGLNIFYIHVQYIHVQCMQCEGAKAQATFQGTLLPAILAANH